MIRIWILSALHWILGCIIAAMSITGLLKIGFSTSALYLWFKLLIGIIIVFLGFLFARNIFKQSEGSFFNLN